MGPIGEDRGGEGGRSGILIHTCLSNCRNAESGSPILKNTAHPFASCFSPVITALHCVDLSSAVWIRAVLCGPGQHCVDLSSAVWIRTALCESEQRCVAPCSAVCAVWIYAVLCGSKRCRVDMSSAVWLCAALFGSVWCCVDLCGAGPRTFIEPVELPRMCHLQRLGARVQREQISEVALCDPTRLSSCCMLIIPFDTLPLQQPCAHHTHCPYPSAAAVCLLHPHLLSCSSLPRQLPCAHHTHFSLPLLSPSAAAACSSRSLFLSCSSLPLQLLHAHHTLSSSVATFSLCCCHVLTKYTNCLFPCTVAYIKASVNLPSIAPPATPTVCWMSRDENVRPEYTVWQKARTIKDQDVCMVPAARYLQLRQPKREYRAPHPTDLSGQQGDYSFKIPNKGMGH
eukprot:1160393-Pelagomonas_calceolata.AAC.12